MNKKKNKISICIPTYQGETFIGECLESISNQTFQDFEVIISDNLSQDNTVAICQAWAKKQSFPVLIYSNPHQGIGINWNYAIKKSNGDYIKLLFQDDYMKEDCLEAMYNASQSQNAKIVVCKRNIVFQNGIVNQSFLQNYGDLQKSIGHQKEELFWITKSLFKSAAFFQSPLNKVGEPSTTLISKDVFQKVGYFDESLKQILDYEFYYRALLKFDILVLSQKLLNFRIHDQQATQVNKSNNIQEDQNYFGKDVPKLFFRYLSYNKKKEIITKKIMSILKNI